MGDFAPGKTVKIFYADDDDDDCYFFKKAVEEIACDCEVETYENGVKLLNNLALAPGRSNLIFLDINMPMKNGIECLKEIKANSSWSGASVYMISTSNDPHLVEASIKEGADGYIKKPSDFNELKQKLANVINAPAASS